MAELAARSANICVIGLGLIGGSFAKALKLGGHNGRITGVIRSERTGIRALELGVVDTVTSSVADGVADADVIMLAVPMLSMRDQLQQIKPALRPSAIITDAGSVKGQFIEDARSVFGSMQRIVPGHPIAGRESSGIDAIEAELFTDRRVLLTPDEQTATDAVALVRQLWEMTGAEVECLSAPHHDRVLAATSHLPHVLAFALVDMLATRQEAEEIFRYAAGGFRDSTRIASGDPVMWRDICLTNREPLSDAIQELQAALGKLATAIDKRDADAIETTFRRAKIARDKHIIKP